MGLQCFITNTAKSLPDAENALVTTETIRSRLAPDISAFEEIHSVLKPALTPLLVRVYTLRTLMLIPNLVGRP
jgi:hypothetical protein